MVWPFAKKKVIDFTQSRVSLPRQKPQATQTSEYRDLTSDSGLGFLGTIASSSENTSELGNQHLKVKIEDVEYKLESLNRQISKILDRLDLAEKKIDRNNRLG